MLFASLALAVLASSAAPQEQTEHVYRIDEVELTIDLSSLKSIKAKPFPEEGQLRAWWRAKLGDERLEITVHAYNNRRMRVATPEDLMSIAETHKTQQLAEADRTSTKVKRWEFDEEHFTPGKYGYIPYALIGTKLEAGEKPHHYVCMAGVTQTKSYTVEIDSHRPLSEESQAALLEFLRTKIQYTGEVRDREWKDEEAEARWKDDAPDDLADDLEFFRTDHFIILTNSSGKKNFAKELEKAYEKIRAVYPFEERKELRLLPIFLFRTPEQYYDFCVKTIGWSHEQAEDSKGVAYQDFYATWYEAPKDPVHIHEVTHQLFGNRLHLSGGGSWFQEGVAEYMSTSKNERRDFRHLVKKKKQVELHDFFRVRSLLGSNPDERTDGTDPATEAYLQAACLIEFVRESKPLKGKFQEFIHKVGAVPRSDVKRIEAALREVYGFGIDKFEEAFLKYWAKR